MKKNIIRMVSIFAVTMGVTAFLCQFFRVDITKEEVKAKEEQQEIRSVFYSYIEIKKYFQNQPEEEAKKRIVEQLDFLKEKGWNRVLLQVRPFSDAIYPSKIYPSSSTIVEKEGDPLSYDFLKLFLEEAHARKIEVHAWINPYRVRNQTDLSSLSTKNPAFLYLGTSKVKGIDGKGIYYNPASEEVQDLIISGIEELLENYDIDGIHFDDYFYPSDDIDEQEYKEYQAVMTRQEFHLTQVNHLVQRVYETVKKKEGVLFGISPEGNIENNYEKNAADVKTWLKEEGYIDYIMPQIYYGFDNEVKPFQKTLEEWHQLIQNEVDFLPALALYKAGEPDSYAKGGSLEWVAKKDIIQKEVEASRKLSKYQGFSIFRFDFLYQTEGNENLIQERENLFELLKKDQEKKNS